MSWLLDQATTLGGYLYPYLGNIATAIVTCVLVVFHDVIHGFVKRSMRQTPFIIRTLTWVVLIAFGYGLLITQVSPWLEAQLAALQAAWLLLVISVTFLAIGMWAERNRQI